MHKYVIYMRIFAKHVRIVLLANGLKRKSMINLFKIVIVWEKLNKAIGYKNKIKFGNSLLRNQSLLRTE